MPLYLTQTHADLGQSKEVTVGELRARIRRLKLKKHVENITGGQGARTLVDARTWFVGLDKLGQNMDETHPEGPEKGRCP